MKFSMKFSNALFYLNTTIGNLNKNGKIKEKCNHNKQPLCFVSLLTRDIIEPEDEEDQDDNPCPKCFPVHIFSIPLLV